MSRTVKTIVEEVLTVPTAKKLWTANYLPAMPFAAQDFSIGALLPAVLYMFRWGHRRGKGNFSSSFGVTDGGKLLAPNIGDVTRGLLNRGQGEFVGFNGAVGEAILGDLLLADCLENRRNALGHQEQVQRIFPTHYLASWVDLPLDASNLRGVPEFLTALLADQKTDPWIQPGGSSRHFQLASGFAENALLELFGSNMEIRSPYASGTATDSFVEATANDIGIDQLLAIRVAQACGSAPLKARGKEETEKIPNQHPLAKRAAQALREDLDVLIRVYGPHVPRQTFLQLLEACIALGLTNILLSTTKLLLDWEDTGVLAQPKEQISWPIFVDCSGGADGKMRGMAEASLSECIRCYERLPVLTMMQRILDDKVRFDRKLRDDLPSVSPDATDWINLLGSLFQETHPSGGRILDSIDEQCIRLAEVLETEDEELDIAAALRRNSNPAIRLAEALCELMKEGSQRKQYMRAIESCLMPNRPNGLAIKRRMRRQDGSGKSSLVDLRAVVLTNPMLDYLVHRHLRSTGKGRKAQTLSLQYFVTLLRERYGLFIDHEPPGQSIPVELLHRNRALLERRLRDLGLLIGVNDAESMKQLKPRYPADDEN